MKEKINLNSMEHLHNLSNTHANFNLIIGENGAGKSSKLRDLAIEGYGKGKNVICLANTGFHRFKPIKSRRYSVNSAINHKPSIERNIHKYLSGIFEDSRRMEVLAQALSYIGYNPSIGVKVKLTDRTLEDVFVEEKLSAGDRLQLENLYNSARSIKKGIHQMDLTGNLNDELNQNYLRVYKNEALLRKANILKSKVKIFLSKGNLKFQVEEASSGEMSLLMMVLSIGSKLSKDNLIFIDEPENSLHPKWQQEYLGMLSKSIFNYSAKIFVATHSPVIIRGAVDLNSASIFWAKSNKLSLVYKKNKKNEKYLIPKPAYLPNDLSFEENKSLESLCYNLLGFLTPENYYLSSVISKMLDALSQKELTLEVFNQGVLDLQSKSNSVQFQFLDSAAQLASEIYNDLHGV